MKCENFGKLDLELYFVGELEGAQAEEVERHLQGCESCSARLSIMEARKADFLGLHPYTSFKQAAFRPEKKTWFSAIAERLLRPALIPVYGMALIAVFVVPISLKIKQTADPAPSGIVYKGDSGLSFLCRRGGIIREGRLDDEYHAGDQIQVRYISSKFSHLALFSIDAGGVVSFYDPDPGSPFCSVKIDAGRQIEFPGSIILDDAPGHELIIGLFSTGPVEREAIKKRLRKSYSAFRQNLPGLEGELKTSPAWEGLTLRTLLIKKGASGSSPE